MCYCSLIVGSGGARFCGSGFGDAGGGLRAEGFYFRLLRERLRLAFLVFLVLCVGLVYISLSVMRLRF